MQKQLSKNSKFIKTVHRGFKLPTTYHLPPTNSKGQALIEVLIAVSVLTIGFSGVMTLLSRSISLNRVVADNHVATYLAAEGIEVVKNIMDSNTIQNKPWASGFLKGSYEVSYDSTSLAPNNRTKIHFDPDDRIYSYTGSVPTNFVRTIRIEPVSIGGMIEEIRVVSEVNWITRGGGEFKVELEDRFFDWRRYAETVVSN